MALLLKILSVIGLGRETGSFSTQMQEIMIEGLGAIEVRSRLAQQEWLEEKARLQQLVIYALLCFGLLIVTSICLSAALVATFWASEYRFWVIWVISAFWTFCLLLCIWRVFAVMRQGKHSFSYTKQELKEDWKAVKDQF